MKIDFSSVPNALAYVTLRLECTGANQSVSTGTGFVFNFGGKTGRVIVTNKHVLHNMDFLTFSFTKSSTKNEPVPGEFTKVAVPGLRSKWIGHPDVSVDLAVILMDKIEMYSIGPEISQNRSPQLFVSSLDKSLIRPRSQLSSLKLIEEIIMVGYPIGLWDQKNNFPLVRRGITATHPGVDFDGAHEFLIDCAVYPGSSGSPVFRYTPEFPMKSGGGISIQGGEARVELLGILFAGYEQKINGEIEVVDIPTTLTPVPRTNIPVNVGKVIRAEKVLEMEGIL